ncbi:MAG: alpha-1,3-galactosidase B [Phocaeicola sp.]|nr:alpha-1,3-galactosidase B [Phocaeicola sp.]MDY3913441.1 alpha-1,3-galactosidase B [Phocaeicola sp.]MDY5938502.1 alpha-1,3-galactosidase B [Phocaeicola sp.]
MQKLLFFLLLPILWAYDTTNVVLTPESFGAVANDETQDNTLAFARLIEAAQTEMRAGRSVEIVLGNGTYHFYPTEAKKYELFISNHDHEPLRPVALFIDKAENLTIKGNNTLLAMHGRMIPVVVQKSKNVKLQGFRIDYPRPALSQIEVVGIKDNRVEVRVLPETQYEIKENRFVLKGEGYEQSLFVAMPFRADRHMKWNRADVSFNPKQIEVNEQGNLYLYHWGEQPYVEVGDRYVLRSYYRPTPGILLSDAVDTQIQDVTVHYAEGMALVAQNCTNVTLHHFSVAVPEKSERYFTTQADATHFSGCRGKIISTQGLYEHMADDAINVHGTYLRVDSIIDNQTVIAAFAHEQSFGYTWYEEGDALRLIDRNTLLPLTGGMGATVEKLNTHQLQLKFASVDALAGLKDCQMAVENLTAHPSVEFEKNIVRNNRARGALFSTPKPVICAYNVFDHTHGSAILLCGDANGWYESGPCEDVHIHHNTFINALTAKYQFTKGVISIYPVLKEVSDKAYYHGRVVVEDNVFHTFDSPLYFALSVREFLFRKNQVQTNTDFVPIFPHTESKVEHVGTLVAD